MNPSNLPTVNSHPYTPHTSAEEAVNYLDHLIQDMDYIKSVMFDFLEEETPRMKHNIKAVCFAIRRVEGIARLLDGATPYSRDNLVFEAYRHSCEAWKNLAYLQRGGARP